MLPIILSYAYPLFVQTCKYVMKILWLYLSYSVKINYRKRFAFLCNLASTAKHQPFGRAGLMGLAECIASAASGIGILIHARTESYKGTSLVDYVSGFENEADKKELLDIFRYVVGRSKQHFNPSYRLQGF